MRTPTSRTCRCSNETQLWALRSDALCPSCLYTPALSAVSAARNRYTAARGLRQKDCFPAIPGVQRITPHQTTAMAQ
jgi:hypothetical protein